jgi:hypothetical protein
MPAGSRAAPSGETWGGSSEAELEHDGDAEARGSDGGGAVGSRLVGRRASSNVAPQVLTLPEASRLSPCLAASDPHFVEGPRPETVAQPQ